MEYPSGKSEQAEQVAAVLGDAPVDRNDSIARVTVVLGNDFALPSDYALPTSPDTISSAGGWKTIAQMVPFAVRAPAYLPEGYSFAERMPAEGRHTISRSAAGPNRAFTMLYHLKENGEWTDQYMGITETTWLDAPAAGEGREVNGMVLPLPSSEPPAK